MQQQIFVVPKFWYWLTKLGIVLFGSMLILSLLLPILEKDDEKNVIGAMLFGLAVSAFFLYEFLKINKELPYSTLVIDDEGIWYQHLGKADALVPWSKVTRMKERQILQRLELLDDRDNVLIKAEYQLENLTQLRDIITEKIYTDIQPHHQTFTIKGYQRLSFVGSIVLFIGLIWQTREQENTLIFSSVMLVLFAGILIEYLTTVNKITIANDYFVLGFPLRKKIIPFTEVTDIKTIARYLQDSRLLQIGIFIEGRKKPYHLAKLGIDDKELLVILRQVAGIK